VAGTLGRAAGLVARVAAVTATAAILGVWGSADVSALSCVERPNDEAAAREAVNGEHPLWAKGYMVAVVESVSDDDEGGPVSVTVRPTHVFAGQYPERLTLQVRPDGPPNPGMFQPGRPYFLSLGSGVPAGEPLIEPCAPNFEVSPGQVERLVAVAPHVEVRESEVPTSNDPLIAGIAIVAAIGLGTAMFVRRR
jgi:hypothetical protein